MLLVGRVATPAAERSASATSTTTGNAALDLHTTVRAAQALSSELEPNRVVACLMQLLQENAGAQRAVLLFSSQAQVSVVAILSESQVRAGLSEPLFPSHPVAHSVVQFVLRTREHVVLSDAPADSRFAEDPRIKSAGGRSVLAVPLLHQGRLSGLLYLEQDVAHAFPVERVTLLGVLAAQSAIVLENARLYVDLQTANTGLEAKVAERTAALNKALKELWAEMDLAQKIQRVLLPPGQTFFRRYEFAGVMKSADQIGGHYYDAFEAGGKLWLLVGDVSGHGVSAGLIMRLHRALPHRPFRRAAGRGLRLMDGPNAVEQGPCAGMRVNYFLDPWATSSSL